MIAVEYRRTPWSNDVRRAMLHGGISLADIVDIWHGRPDEFEQFGAVMIMRADGSRPMEIPRQLWARVYPKPGMAVFVSTKPQGDGIDVGQIFAVVGAIALIALVTWVSGGGIAVLAPSLIGTFGAGTVGASVAAAAISAAGSIGLSMLTAPSAGAAAGAGSSRSLGQAGVAANVLGAYQQVPAILGQMRVSPPYLARPYTTAQDSVLTIHGVVGLCGPCEITDVKINDTDAADVSEFTYEIREGWDSDEQLTLVTEQVFEDNIGVQMSNHILQPDGESTLDRLLEPFASSYPKPHIFKTCRDCNKFRFLLAFPQGAVRNFYRIRIRNRSGGGWINLPQLLLKYSGEPHLAEIVLLWEQGDGYPWDGVPGGGGYYGAYYSNPEWEADSYFYDSGVTFPSLNADPAHSDYEPYKFTFYLDPAVFPIGEYDIEITKSASIASVTEADINTYTSGYFTFATTSGGEHFIPNQEGLQRPVIIQSIASYRHEYPINERGLALIAYSARDMNVQSVSAVFQPYVPIWNGVDWSEIEPSRNPGALLRWIWTGGLNPRPMLPSLLDDTIAELYEYCELNGLACDAMVSGGSVEAAATLVAQCGDSAMRRSDRFGVFIDRDRSAEPAETMFSAHNMTQPLMATKSFFGGTIGIVPSFYDRDLDWKIEEFPTPVYDDGTETETGALIEQVAYEGLTERAIVERRAKLDIRRATGRAIRYTWETRLAFLNVKKGSLVAVAHDILIDTYAQARVADFTFAGGNLTSIILNSEVEDAPVLDYDGIFAVQGVFALSQVFAVGVQVGAQIQLGDGSIITVPISGVSGAALTVDGAFAFPSSIRRGDLVSVGPRDRETRRLIIADIRPTDETHAQIEAFDEAPGIFEGL